LLDGIEIVQGARPRLTADIAAEIGITDDDIEFYGKYKAKVSPPKKRRK
jgi:formate--tetrahydrofolate ligase